MDKRCIVICDSGIGGLRLLRRLEHTLKGQTLLYYADFENLPYGNKSGDELVKIAEKNLEKFLPFCPKTVVFACNTLSTNTLGKTNPHGVRLVRVLPKVKVGKRGLLLCTEATANSDYVRLLKKENSLLDVLPVKGLAEEIEKWVRCGKKINLEGMLRCADRDYGYVSLGCTHYPIIQAELKKLFPLAEFLSGEEDAFDKIVNSVTTIDTDDHGSEVCFIGKEAKMLKSLYNKGIFENV